MGLLDSVLGSVLGGHPQRSALQSVLGSILAGSGSQSYSGGGGGLGGLLDQFARAGMGNVANSWVGTGPNQQITPNQLQNVFGQDQVNQWSQQTGMPQHTLLQELSNLLPRAVDQATPNGQVPASPFDAPGLELPQR